MSLWVKKRVKPLRRMLDPMECIIFDSLKIVPTHKCPTVGMYGKTMFVNPSFMSKLDSRQKVDVIKHEIIHLVIGEIA